MDGFLNMLKPPGMTSAELVGFIRRQLPRGTRVGHGGTLDPDACGVLPIAVGSASRLFDYLIDKKKVYLAQMTLGVETDTQDASGNVIHTADASNIGREEIEAVLGQFTGIIMQTPPAYSAVKKDGKRLYDIAREGGDTTVESRPAQIFSIEYISKTGENDHLLRVECGKGVYIRTLLHDIGQTLGCGAHMSMLVREQVGVFGISNAVLPCDLTPETIESRLFKMDYPLERYIAVNVDPARTDAVRNGNQLKADWLQADAAFGTGDIVRLYLNGVFAGMADIEEDGSAKFRAMLWKGTQE